MKTPKQFLSELERAQAAHERAFLILAESSVLVGNAATRVLEALAAEQRKAGGKRKAPKARSSAAYKRYWARISPEERAERGRGMIEGKRRAAEKRRAKLKRVA